MKEIAVTIIRGTKGSQHEQHYQVPAACETVLSALQYIYRHLDNSLAFNYDCRFRQCGLCAVTVNDKPVLSCTAKLKEGMKIGPLQGVPLIRDLMVDRSFMPDLTRELQLFVVPEPEGGEVLEGLAEEYFNFGRCNECLACVSACPAGADTGAVFGPFVWVRLAQLHLDPRDKLDRLEQAARLGVNGCSGCGACKCTAGINLKKVLAVLKQEV